MEQKDARNCYTCRKCGKEHWTVNLHEGVTPMFITCCQIGCGGTAVSSGYRVRQDTIPEWGWYSPNDHERERLRTKEPGMYQHVQMGGLLLRLLDAIEMERYGMVYRR